MEEQFLTINKISLLTENLKEKIDIVQKSLIRLLKRNHAIDFNEGVSSDDTVTISNIEEITQMDQIIENNSISTNNEFIDSEMTISDFEDDDIQSVLKKG